MMPKLPSLRSRAVLSTAVGLTLIAGAVAAQTATQLPPDAIQWDKRRLDQLDRNVRRLERAVTQRNAAGQPVLVEPDPEVVALQGSVSDLTRRLGDLEDSLQRMNGDLERSTFELEEANRDNAALRARITDTDNRIAALERANELNAPITADSATNSATGDLAAAIELVKSDPARADRAFQTVAVTWPDTNEAREANSRLGDLRVAQNDRAGAVAAYAAALQGWPRITWAGETTLKLAENLVATDRKTQACGALGEFNRRYAEAAAPNLRTRAGAIRTRAECAA
ncbi:tol-pal system protein [Brevundimonas sp. Leaf363]|uniref:tol-pal system protein n=1 Tax=Brevundimonas sp. Leaf363 TaxID=1736353 RepID=UPI000B1A074D|nr:tol-pal system protein [Brevundimonas sp. Leaf363]